MYNQKDVVGSMSMRQQILYIMQMSQQPTEWDNKDEAAYVNPNERFDELRFKLREGDLLKHPERWRMLAHSLNEFIPIKKNRFLERNKMILLPKDYPQFSCSCQPRSRTLNFQSNRRGGSRNTFAEDEQSYDCGEQCLNRSVAQDCVTEVCPVGDACKNRRFQLHQNAYVYPAKTEHKGWGLAAGEPISKGSFIMQYVGEVYHEDSPIGQKRIEKYKTSTCTYMMRTEFGEIIDPTYYGNVARFMNHSCDPNCETRKWTVGKETSVGIFARRDIQEDEELSFDYQFDTFKTPFTKCYCGTSKCKGYLGLAVYDKGEDNVNAPVCKLCTGLVETKEQLVVCKGTCEKVFHKKCIQQVTNRFDRQNYYCKRCTRVIRAAAKKEREEEEQNPKQYSDDEQMSDGSQQENSADVMDTDKNSPTKTPRGKSRNQFKPKFDVIFFPIRDDEECKRFLEKTPENALLDKVIHREIFQIDQAQKNPYVDLMADEDMDVDKDEDGSENLLKVSKQRGFSKKRKMGVFSLYYNFYFEMVKRLKLRMKENRKNFKFRKIYIRSKSSAPVKKTTTKKIVRKKQPRSVSKSKVLKDGEKNQKNPGSQKAQYGQLKTSEIIAPLELEEERKESSPLHDAPMIEINSQPESPHQIDEEKEDSQSLNIDTSYGGEIEEVNSQTMNQWQKGLDHASLDVKSQLQKDSDLEPQNADNMVDLKESEPDAKEAHDVEGEEQEDEEIEESIEEEIIEEEIEEEMTEPAPSCSEIAQSDDEESEYESDLSQTSSEQGQTEQQNRAVGSDDTSSDANSRSQYSDMSGAHQQVTPSGSAPDPKSGRLVTDFMKAYRAEQEMRERQTSQAKEESPQISKRSYQKRNKVEEPLIKVPPRKRGRPSKVELAERARLAALQQEQDEASEDQRNYSNDQSNQKQRRLRLNKDLAFEGLAGEVEPASRELKKIKRKLSTAERNLKKESKSKDAKQMMRVRREKLEAKVRGKVEDFVDQEIEFEESQVAIKNIEYRTSRLNLYEDLFNLVFVKNIDLLEAVSNLYLNWENPWGNLVTLKLTCNQTQFIELLGILQFTIDEMIKYQLLQTTLSQQTQARYQELSGKKSSSILPFLVMTLKVPKVFLKKLIGYQEKVLLQLKQTHEVNFAYDERLVTDVVYALDETSSFRIYGKGRDVIKVSSFLQNALDKLSIRTLAVTKEESKFILDNIKEVKSQIDPCEIRVKRHIKDKNDIRHPFFFAPNQSRDVCLVGTQLEIDRAETRLYEFYAYRLDKPDLTRTSLCCLLPLQLREDIYEIKKDLLKLVPDVVTIHYLPQRPRRHITIYMTGSWKNLVEAKIALSSMTSEMIKRISNLSCQNFEEFQEFTFCQQLRFNFKILKRIVLEQSWVFLKFWDTTSVDLKSIAESSDSTTLSDQTSKDTALELAAQITRTPFLQAAFPELTDQSIPQADLLKLDQASLFKHQKTNPVSQAELLQLGQEFLVKQYKSNRDKLLAYLKVYDNETALNSLFVLSEENQNLPQICQNMNIDKPLFVQMAFLTIQEILRKQNFPTIQAYRTYEIRQLAEQEVSKRLERHDRFSSGKPDYDEAQDHESMKRRKNNDPYQYYQGATSPRRRRSRSRSHSRHSQYPAADQPDYQPSLKLQRFASSRQEFVSAPQLLDVHDRNSMRVESDRRERDRDYEMRSRNYYDQDKRDRSTRELRAGDDRYRDSESRYREKEADRNSRYGKEYDYDRDRYPESRDRGEVRSSYRTREPDRDYSERHSLLPKRAKDAEREPERPVLQQYHKSDAEEEQRRELAHAKQMEKVLIIQRAQRQSVKQEDNVQNKTQDQQEIQSKEPVSVANENKVEDSQHQQVDKQVFEKENGKDKMDNKEVKTSDELQKAKSTQKKQSQRDNESSEHFKSNSSNSERLSPKPEEKETKKTGLHFDLQMAIIDSGKKQEQSEAQPSRKDFALVSHSEQANLKQDLANEQKLMKCYEAELAALEQKFPSSKPGLIQAQQLAKTRDFSIKRKSRSRSRSMSPDFKSKERGYEKPGYFHDSKSPKNVNKYKKQAMFVKKKSFDKFSRNNFTSTKQEYYRNKVSYNKYGYEDNYKPNFDQSYHHRPRDKMAYDRRDSERFNPKYERGYNRSPSYQYRSPPHESLSYGGRYDERRGPDEPAEIRRYQKPREPGHYDDQKTPHGSSSDRFKQPLGMKDEKRPNLSKQDSKGSSVNQQPVENRDSYEQSRSQRVRPLIIRQQDRSPPEPHKEGSSGGSRTLKPGNYESYEQPQRRYSPENSSANRYSERHPQEFNRR